MANDLGMDIGLGVATGGIWNVGKAVGLWGGHHSAPNYDDLIAQRQAQIDAFSARLDQARSSVLANYQNLQANTMKRFSGDFEASLAGRGLSPAGGAFASGVGREAGMLQGQYDTLNSQMTQENLNTIGNLQMGLGQEQLGLGMQQRMQNYQNRLGTQQALGSLVGTGIGFLTGGPMGANIGGGMGRSIFGGSQPGMFNGSGAWNPDLLRQPNYSVYR